MAQDASENGKITHDGFLKEWLGTGDNSKVIEWINKARRGEDPVASKLLYEMLRAFITNNTPGWPMALRFYLLGALEDLFNGMDGHKAFYFQKSKKRGKSLDEAWGWAKANAVFHEMVHNPQLSEIQACQNAVEELKDGYSFFDRREGVRTEHVEHETTVRDAYHKMVRIEAERAERLNQKPFFIPTVENNRIVDWEIDE